MHSLISVNNLSCPDTGSYSFSFLPAVAVLFAVTPLPGTSPGPGALLCSRAGVWACRPRQRLVHASGSVLEGLCAGPWAGQAMDFFSFHLPSLNTGEAILSGSS